MGTVGKAHFRVRISPVAAVMLGGMILGAVWGHEDVGEWAIVLLAAGIHEAGHLCMARLCGVAVSGIRLDILGARLRLEGMMSYAREWLVAAGGPLANLLSALWVMPIWLYRGARPEGGLFVFLVASLGLGGLNLLPVGTMDGGRMLNCLISWLLDERAAAACLRVTTFACLMALWLLSVYMLLRAGNMLSLFAFSLCLLFRMASPDGRGREV